MILSEWSLLRLVRMAMWMLGYAYEVRVVSTFHPEIKHCRP